MRTWSKLLIAAPIAAGMLVAPAQADWHGHGNGYRGGQWHGNNGQWHGNNGWQHHNDGGNAAAGALLGLGVGALIGGVIASSQPRYYAPPPPVVYAPPPPYYGPTYGYPSGY